MWFRIFSTVFFLISFGSSLAFARGLSFNISELFVGESGIDLIDQATKNGNAAIYTIKKGDIFFNIYRIEGKQYCHQNLCVTFIQSKMSLSYSIFMAGESVFVGDSMREDGGIPIEVCANGNVDCVKISYVNHMPVIVPY
ncbi:MAG: hypothetical protein OXR62_14885 [Ahrensia sp.]|nr:hypothetical protein [Ahrensia sp.]